MARLTTTRVLLAALALCSAAGTASADFRQVRILSGVAADNEDPLGGDPDPYVRFYVNGTLLGTTPTRSNDHTPTWNWTGPTHSPNLSAGYRFEMWDDDGITSADDHIATFFFNPSPASLPSNGGYQTFTLSSGPHRLTIQCLYSDTTPPNIVCPAPITVEDTIDDGQIGELVTFAATATDNVDSTPTITYSVPPGSLFPIGTTFVTCTARDDRGNTRVCSFPVTVTRKQWAVDRF